MPENENASLLKMTESLEAKVEQIIRIVEKLHCLSNLGLGTAEEANEVRSELEELFETLSQL